MPKTLKLCLMILCCGLTLAGCATKKNTDTDALRADRFRRAYEASLDRRDMQTEQLLTRTARSAIGTPYVRGGSKPGGFDCSGLVSWAYKSVGINLPRTAREQSQVGQRITDQAEMRPGDIVAFRHPRRGYHTGIYVGDGKFVHSPRRRTTVRINRLDDAYFSKTFLGARRVNLDGNEDLRAQAASRLQQFEAEQTIRDQSKKAKKQKRDKAKKQRNNKKKQQQVASNSKKKQKNDTAKTQGRSSQNKSQVAANSKQKKQKSQQTAAKNTQKKKQQVAANTSKKQHNKAEKSRASKAKKQEVASNTKHKQQQAARQHTKKRQQVASNHKK